MKTSGHVVLSLLVSVHVLAVPLMEDNDAFVQRKVTVTSFSDLNVDGEENGDQFEEDTALRLTKDAVKAFKSAVEANRDVEKHPHKVYLRRAIARTEFVVQIRRAIARTEFVVQKLSHKLKIKREQSGPPGSEEMDKYEAALAGAEVSVRELKSARDMVKADDERWKRLEVVLDRSEVALDKLRGKLKKMNNAAPAKVNIDEERWKNLELVLQNAEVALKKLSWKLTKLNQAAAPKRLEETVEVVNDEEVTVEVANEPEPVEVVNDEEVTVEVDNEPEPVEVVNDEEVTLEVANEPEPAEVVNDEDVTVEVDNEPEPAEVVNDEEVTMEVTDDDDDERQRRLSEITVEVFNEEDDEDEDIVEVFDDDEVEELQPEQEVNEQVANAVPAAI